MGVLAQLEPKEVFSYFETICGIPHGSGNTGPIADYLVQFAKDNGLEWYRDAANNVVLTKPASPGYEGADTIILQAHTDMVCEKAPGVEFDFTKDAIRPIIEDDVIRADGTTLGADDGISVAMILALLSVFMLMMIFQTREKRRRQNRHRLHGRQGHRTAHRTFC